MTQYVVSRYNHHLAWLNDYTNNFILYDRSPQPLAKAIVVPNIGSDIYDKFTYIIDNYENLAEVTILIKCNLFDYIKPREFEKIKDNQTFTPILSLDHHTYEPVCFYKDGMYYEINNYFYLNAHPPKNEANFRELQKILKMNERKYNAFAPGSGYILTKQDIQRHPKSFYENLRSFLDWTIYPGEAQMLERSLYYLWGTDIIRP